MGPGLAATADVVERLRAAGCVFAEEEAEVLVSSAASAAILEEMLVRRVAGVPLEVVVGFVDFCGHRIVVEPGVFVPRRRTELLAELAVSVTAAGGIVVDLCCGTGAVAVAIGDAVSVSELHAVDISPDAVACARRNLVPAGGRVWCGDLYDALPARLRGQVDVVVANAPYVPTGELVNMPVEAREHEPRESHDGGGDGVEIHRRIAAGAPRWLRRGGFVLVETGRRQAARTADAFRAAGLTTEVREDLERDATVVSGRLLSG